MCSAESSPRLARGAYLPISPHISPCLPVSPCISLYLPVSPYISLAAPCEGRVARDRAHLLRVRVSVRVSVRVRVWVRVRVRASVRVRVRGLTLTPTLTCAAVPAPQLGQRCRGDAVVGALLELGTELGRPCGRPLAPLAQRPVAQHVVVARGHEVRHEACPAVKRRGCIYLACGPPVAGRRGA